MDWLRHQVGFKPRAVYHLPEFWDAAYMRGQREPFEWAGVSLEDLYDYTFVDASLHRPDSTSSCDSSGRTIRRQLAADIPFHSRVLIIGSGTSLLGHKMVRAGWRGGITQLDFSGVVIFEAQEGLEWVLGDAREMQYDKCYDAVIDKGTIDALYLSAFEDHATDIGKIVRGVAAALLPQTGVFIAFSLSHPRYIWHLLADPTTATLWDARTSQVRKLDSIYMYVLRRSRRRLSRQDMH